MDGNGLGEGREGGIDDYAFWEGFGGSGEGERGDGGY